MSEIGTIEVEREVAANPKGLNWICVPADARRLGFAEGYRSCYETDPHVRTLVEAAKRLKKYHAFFPEVIVFMEFEEALRPFEKEEETNAGK